MTSSSETRRQRLARSITTRRRIEQDPPPRPPFKRDLRGGPVTQSSRNSAELTNRAKRIPVTLPKLPWASANPVGGKPQD